MPMFCGKCGKPMEAGTRFCPSCGAVATAPAQAVPAPPVAPQQAQWTPPPAAAPMQAGAPPAKSGGALKIILIALGVIVILGVVSIIGVGLFLRRIVHDNVSVKEGANGKAEVSINTPGGQLKVSSKPEISEEKLGVPIYPGAQAAEGAGSVSFTGNDNKSGTFGGAAFTTTDSMDKVVDFYKSRLGSKATVLETTAEGKHSVVLNVTNENSWKTITIEDEGNGTTKIAVASVSGNTPQ